MFIQDGRASTGRGGTNGRDEEDWNEEERERERKQQDLQKLISAAEQQTDW